MRNFVEVEVSLKKKLRTLFVCLALEVAVLNGANVRPDEIRALMHQLNLPALAHVLPGERDSGDDQTPESESGPLESRD